ncbi:MAG: hypothetical protein ACTH30_06725 [Leucobacter sp.]
MDPGLINVCEFTERVNPELGVAQNRAVALGDPCEPAPRIPRVRGGALGGALGDAPAKTVVLVLGECPV